MFDLDNDPMDTETCVYVGCSNPTEPGYCVCRDCREMFDEYVRLDRIEMEEKRAEAMAHGF